MEWYSDILLEKTVSTYHVQAYSSVKIGEYFDGSYMHIHCTKYAPTVYTLTQHTFVNIGYKVGEEFRQ
jgi:hypothetical protein